MGLYINLVQMAMYYAKNTDKPDDSSNSVMLDSVYDESVLAQYVERELENSSLFSSFDIKYNMGPLFAQNWNFVLLGLQNFKLCKDVSVVDAKATEKADVDILEPYANTGLKVKVNTYSVRITSFTCTMLWLPNLLIIKNDRELKVYTYNMLDFSFVNNRLEKKRKIFNYGALMISGPYMRIEIQTPIDKHAEIIAEVIADYKNCFPVNKKETEKEVDPLDLLESQKQEKVNQKGQDYARIIKMLGFEAGLIDCQHIDNYFIYLYKSNSQINDSLKSIEKTFNNRVGDSFLFKEVGDGEFLIYEEVVARALESTVIKRVLDDAMERAEKLDVHKKAKENMGKVKDSGFDVSFVPINKNKNDAQTAKSEEKTKVKTQVKTENFKAVKKEDSLDDIFEELNSLTGLDNVKEELKELVYVVQNRQRREEQGLKVPPISLHLVFTGNPGTGKTTVARIVAKIYKALGLLSEGQMIETDRSGLVAGYMGQTAIKTKEVIDTAIGGVLFIDEAYALTNKTEGDFGIEAVDTLLKSMEDNRDNLVVIVAGYDDLMEEFIESNPGLKSRFNRYIHFDDYKPDEMYEIFENMCIKYQYKISDDARDVIVSHFSNIEPSEIGNGRGIRNIFEKVITEQAKRIETADNKDSDLQMILGSDFVNAVKL